MPSDEFEMACAQNSGLGALLELARGKRQSPVYNSRRLRFYQDRSDATKRTKMTLEVRELDIPDVKVVVPKRFGDHRGFFSETYNQALFQEAGIPANFIQDNQSLSEAVNTVRGLHFQRPPFAQAKLVRVLRGTVIDVAVDVRIGSPTFKKWVSVELSAENGAQIFVPRGFLHGFATLTPSAEIAYKVDNYYSAECDGSIAWNDSQLGIDWGIDPKDAIVSKKDANAQTLAEFESPFEYDVSAE